MSAPWYKDQIGQCAKKLVPIVLVLRHKHFRALIPDSSQTSCPSEWLRKTEWRPAAVLRGAGKSVSAFPSTPARSARSVCKLSVLSKTPSRGSGYCSKLSVVSKTPGRSSGPCTTKDRRAPQSVNAASTCSRVRSVQLSSCPSAAVSGRSVGRSSPAQPRLLETSPRLKAFRNFPRSRPDPKLSPSCGGRARYLDAGTRSTRSRILPGIANTGKHTCRKSTALPTPPLFGEAMIWLPSTTVLANR